MISETDSTSQSLPLNQNLESIAQDPLPPFKIKQIQKPQIELNPYNQRSHLVKRPEARAWLFPGGETFHENDYEQYSDSDDYPSIDEIIYEAVPMLVAALKSAKIMQKLQLECEWS